MKKHVDYLEIEDNARRVRQHAEHQRAFVQAVLELLDSVSEPEAMRKADEVRRLLSLMPRARSHLSGFAPRLEAVSGL